MGCAASVQGTSPNTTTAKTPSALERQASSVSSSSNDEADPTCAGVPSPFLPYYTLEALRGNELFGPFLKLHSYDPDTGNLQLSLLVLCTEAAAQQIFQGQLRVVWWEQPGPDRPASRSDGPTSPEDTADGPQLAQVPAPVPAPAPAPVSATGSAGGAAMHGTCGDAAGVAATGKNTRPNSSSPPQPQPPPPPPPPPPQSPQSPQPQEDDVPADASTAPAELLFAWRHWRFWSFRFGTTCSQASKQLLYQVGSAPGCRHAVTVPALLEPWRLAFYSCNGLDYSEELFEVRVPRVTALALWRDVARRHSERPFHLLLGGGDQLYNDQVFEGPHLRGWDKSEDDRDTAAKAALPFTEEMRNEVEEFYFAHYAAHWAQPAYRNMFASVPTFNAWDDHDIVDGWGSYHTVIMNSAVMRGVFRAAQLFYLLFQHHTTLDRLPGDGYWCAPATCALLQLGSSAALLAPDTRTCRSQERVLPAAFLQQAAERLRALPASVRHVVVLLGSPLVYPRLPVQDALQKLDDLFTGDTLISVVMQKTGLAAKVDKRFGMVSLLDDIIDQWSAHQHVSERDLLLEVLMAVAAEKGFRMTLLSGDVHCAGYGMVHSRGDESAGGAEDMGLPSETARAADPRFIPQVISSAIVNSPPPAPLLKLLCLAGRNPQPILQRCVQRMVPLFGPASELDSFLLGKRNWCEVTLGDPRGHLRISWRCERELGSAEVDEYSVTVPPLMAAPSN